MQQSKWEVAGQPVTSQMVFAGKPLNEHEVFPVRFNQRKGDKDEIQESKDIQNYRSVAGAVGNACDHGMRQET